MNAPAAPAKTETETTASETPAELSRRVQEAQQAAGWPEPGQPQFPEFTPNALAVLRRRYLARDRAGSLLEDPEQLFHRVARNLAQAEANYDRDPAAIQQAEEKFHRLMRSLDFLPNSPTLMNAGRELQQLSACFVLPVEDSLESIFSQVKNTARIHKSGGGTGFSFSRLRPEGDIVGATGGVASGPVSFISAFDSATDVVKQGGTRRGANMAILNHDHPDIMQFIQAKADGRQLSNFNISVAVTEKFMEQAAAGADYDLVNPRTGAKTGTLNAAAVLQAITEMAWRTGDPGIVFLDRINRDNPNPQLGRIESTNPCGEQPLLPWESCNLGSINLVRMLRRHPANAKVQVNWKRLVQTTAAAVHLLDNVIDMNDYPLPEIAEMSQATRRIGIGVMGFADLLLQLGLPYDSPAALALAQKIMARIRKAAHAASRDLAAKRGCFPAWEASVYAQRQQPMRNSAPLTIAPTGTISIIAGAASGIEPLFALSYVRNVMDQTRLYEANPSFGAVAEHYDFQTPELLAELAEIGSLAHISPSFPIPEWVRRLFRTSHDLSPEWHVRMQAAFQQHTDNAVSKTINFPSAATVADVALAYRLAWEAGCKGITVYRDGSKNQQVLQAAGADSHPAAEPELPPRPERKVQDRPREIQGVTRRLNTGHGPMYVTVNFLTPGRPFELFTTLGKSGGCDSAQLEAISRLTSLALRSGIDPEQVAAQLRGITCCPAWDSGELVRSAPDAVARVLESWMKGSAAEPQLESRIGQMAARQPDLLTLAAADGSGPSPPTAAGRSCPDCGDPLHAVEGCLLCSRCGWSRCE